MNSNTSVWEFYDNPVTSVHTSSKSGQKSGKEPEPGLCPDRNWSKQVRWESKLSKCLRYDEMALRK